MADVVLHLKAQISATTCAVCGASLTRGDRDRWWLHNTWTAAVEHFHEGAAQNPNGWLQPCGVLPKKDAP